MASTNEWFLTVAEAQRRAKRRLPASVLQRAAGGLGKGRHGRDNIAAFSELGLRSMRRGLGRKHDLATSVLGQEMSFPVLISPTGVQAVHPDGEVAVARAAASGDRDGPELVREQARRGRGRRQPADVVPGLLVGSPEAMVQRLERARAPARSA